MTSSRVEESVSLPRLPRGILLPARDVSTSGLLEDDTVPEEDFANARNNEPH